VVASPTNILLDVVLVAQPFLDAVEVPDNHVRPRGCDDRAFDLIGTSIESVGDGKIPDSAVDKRMAEKLSIYLAGVNDTPPI
jgi:hypothetical protein